MNKCKKCGEEASIDCLKVGLDECNSCFRKQKWSYV